MAVLLSPDANALTRYSMASNNFAGLGSQPFTVVVDNRLVIDNQGADDIVCLDSVGIVSTGYRYVVRFANTHNHIGHRYGYVDSTGKKKHRDTTSCGLAFNISDGDTTTVMMSCYDTAPGDDVNDRRLADIVVTRHVEGSSTVLARWTIDDRVDLYDGLTGLAVDVKGDNVVVLVGRHTLSAVGTVDVSRAVSVVSVGLVAGSAALMSIERTMLTVTEAEHIIDDLDWTVETLGAHFEMSTDINEGFYTYLDRDLDESKARLGGRYRVALVASDSGYDIVYVDGAQVNASQWSVGMLKGRLRRTQFAGYYSLLWIDAEHQAIDTDVTAMLTDAMFLTLKFPTLAGEVRFSKDLVF